MILAIIVFTFCAFFGAVYGTYWAFVRRPEERAAGMVRSRLRKSTHRAPRQTVLVKQAQAMSAVGPIDAFLKRGRSHTQNLQDLLEQAGMKTTVGALLSGCAACAALAFYVVLNLTGSVLFGLPAGALAAFIPVNFVKFRRTRRMRQFEEQFPEALDLLARALRAGHAFTTGIDMVATEMVAPIGPEFRTLYDQQNYGMAMPDALRLFARRIPVLDARFFVTAVLIQRESGGNLSEVLDNLAGVMRERFRVKRQMRVLSAHGRITGWILAGLPPALALVLFTINQDHRTLMFGDPLGQKMMMAAVTLQIIGTLIMRKIINIEY